MTNNPSNLNFCNNQEDFKVQIIKAISEQIFSDSLIPIIKYRYDEMISNFEKPFSEWSIREELNYNEVKDLIIPFSDVKYPLFTYDENVGIDLPVWFNYQSTSKKVMLVGMEPKRKPKDSLPGHVTIGSPFALSYLNQNNRFPFSIMYKFIRQLVLSNYSAYITDFGKIYSLRNGKKHNGDGDINYQLFVEELRIYEPDYIICFGKNTYSNVLNFVTNIPSHSDKKVLHFSHPASREKGKRYFELFNNNL